MLTDGSFERSNRVDHADSAAATTPTKLESPSEGQPSGLTFFTGVCLGVVVSGVLFKALHSRS